VRIIHPDMEAVMRKPLSILIPALLVGLTGCGKIGEPMADVVSVTPITEEQPVFAEVLTVTPVTLSQQQVRQACEEHVVERRREERFGDKDGAVIGAVVGGLLGSQVGSGSGRRAATVAGAVGGAFAGREVDRRHQGGQRYSDVETVCQDVTETVDKPNGFKVQYRTPEGGTASRHAVIKPEGPKIEIGTEPAVIGYEVAWRYEERSGTVQMPEQPSGNRLPLSELLPASAAGSSGEGNGEAG
jgi:uncharacterized protein YcfJ